ncbi:MAG: protein kinase [Nannocystis sp.]|nr:protein kinase [Nannocystis sp.]
MNAKPTDPELELVRAHVVPGRVDDLTFAAIEGSWRRVGGSFIDHLVHVGALGVAAARTLRAIQRGYLKAPLAPLFEGFQPPPGLLASPPLEAAPRPVAAPLEPAPRRADLLSAPEPAAAEDTVLGPIPEWNSIPEWTPEAERPLRATPGERRARATGRRSARKIDPVALLAAPPPGARIGVYTLRDVLGAGATAIVYRARDEQQRRSVVLKLLRRDLMPADSQRFQSEARLLARVDHANVVAVIGSGVFRDAPYIVLEDIFAISLEEHLSTAGPLPPQALARVALSVARGLHAAHQAGVLHRDIKPANLLLYGPDGRVKITDFGLASDSDSIRPEGARTLRGTAAYMAPECILTARPVDHRADMYSLGVTLYEAATGELPFIGANLLETMRAHLHEPAPSLRDRAPQLPAPLAAFIARLLRKRPEDRFERWSDVGDAAEELLRALADPISDAVTRAVRGDSGANALPSLYGKK